MTVNITGQPNPGRRLIFLLLAAFILITPALPHVFGIYSIMFRPWMMFSGVGVGLLKGEFILGGAADEETRLTPPEVLGVERYSRAMTRRFPYHVLIDEDLPLAVETFCATLDADQKLYFDGYRQTRDGWIRLTAEDLCGGA